MPAPVPPSGRALLVLGGAGFLGSAICRRFLEDGWRVTACDGLMPRTESALVGFARLPEEAAKVERRIVQAADLADLLAERPVVVDAMGWTSHWGGLKFPHEDLSLNLIPHIALAEAVAEAPPPLLIYLGSRHQYGRLEADGCDETAPLLPIDVQGIHKTAAERHLALAGQRHGFPVASLRFGNSFGPGMPMRIEDVGLIGTFLRDAMADRPVEVLGTHRRRTVHYAPDLAAAVLALTAGALTGGGLPAGFTPLNLPGESVAIHDLAEAICRAVGRGRVELAPLAPEVAAIDVGDRDLDTGRFAALCGPLPLTPLARALAETWAEIARRPGLAGGLA
jgi:UDP-glucose 4-epimerase